MAWGKAGKTNKLWKTDPISKGGGRFLDLGSHLVDQLLQLNQHKVISVYCRMHFDFTEYPGTDSHALLIVGFEDNSSGVIDTSTTATIDKARFYIVGDKGTFIKYGFDPQEEALVSGNIYSAVEKEQFFGKIKYLDKNKSENVIQTEKGDWTIFYKNVAHAINGQPTEHLITAESVRRTIAVLTAALQSVSEKQVITVNI